MVRSCGGGVGRVFLSIKPLVVMLWTYAEGWEEGGGDGLHSTDVLLLTVGMSYYSCRPSIIHPNMAECIF